ncbi:hypothetical protein QNA08_17260 [Chelatococcus sp. SYSU_G07232]|uniref:Uncharacterized protein n=1 Tax=Chelatococcus albus TaxID=3047466 RepID=A0ABT7AKS3_9HYPH|nr:hypothetical protein [Chelatococcus sp. SYSU_G07232]MDJ1159964.1 hypothetical protein [Chelatococcus sp. SYSU_G07232]
MYRAMYAYAWDIAEEGLDAAMERMAGMGIGTLTLAASYHAGKFIRPRGKAGKVVFPEDGTVYFRPRTELYGAIKPRVSNLVEGHDLFSDWPRDARLRLNAWTVLLHNTPLGAAHPDCVVRNAFGDAYVYSLEPCHPDVRAYAVALARDLASRPAVCGLSLETPGYLPYAHGFHHELTQVPLNPWAEILLGLSFSQSCVTRAEAAGVPARRVRDTVARALDRWLASDAAPADDMAMHWALADAVGDPDLLAFLRWRSEPVTSLVGAIRAAMPEGVTLAVIPSVQRPSALAWSEGSDLAALAGVADRLEIPLYERSTARALADLWDVRRRVGRERPLRCILRPGPPDMTAKGELVTLVAELAARGIDEIAFYNDGLLRPHHHAWVRDALAQLPPAGRTT